MRALAIAVALLGMVGAFGLMVLVSRVMAPPGQPETIHHRAE